MTDQPPPTGAADSADPSMEEILASIRRILNDDEVPTLPEGEPAPEVTPEPAPVAAAEAAPDTDDDVLVLDEAMIVATPEPPLPTRAPDPPPRDPFDDIVVPAAAAEPPPSPRAEPPPPEPDPRTFAPDPEPISTELLGAAAAAAAASSVSSLVRTLTAGRATQVYSGGPTLEDMVRAELRPMLKEWLDTYLPPMVERLVRGEIERVVGRYGP